MRLAPVVAVVLMQSLDVNAQVVESELIDTTLEPGGIRLELVVHKPAGSGPFPTVIFNHGSTGRGDNPERFRVTWAPQTVGEYFNPRGWMVVFPQRRGRGRSEGLYDEGFRPDRGAYSCDPAHSLPGMDRAVADIEAVLAHVKARADVDRRSLLIAGQSRGGILAIVLAGKHPKEFAGAINFVGGWMSDKCPDPISINTRSFVKGAGFSGPTVWLYGQPDPFYSLAHSRANFDAFIASGGQGEFLSFSLPGDQNGHALLFASADWHGPLDRFLKEKAVRSGR